MDDISAFHRLPRRLGVCIQRECQATNAMISGSEQREWIDGGIGGIFVDCQKIASSSSAPFHRRPRAAGVREMQGAFGTIAVKNGRLDRMSQRFSTGSGRFPRGLAGKPHSLGMKLVPAWFRRRNQADLPRRRAWSAPFPRRPPIPLRKDVCLSVLCAALKVDLVLTGFKRDKGRRHGQGPGHPHRQRRRSSRRRKRTAPPRTRPRSKRGSGTWEITVGELASRKNMMAAIRVGFEWLGA